MGRSRAYITPQQAIELIEEISKSAGEEPIQIIGLVITAKQPKSFVTKVFGKRSLPKNGTNLVHISEVKEGDKRKAIDGEYFG
jgi:hydrogenase maturation factor